MADRSAHADTTDGSDIEHAADRPPRAPRWVKVFGVVLVALVLLFVIVKATGVGGEHGPMRHLGPGGGGAPTPASTVTGHRPPAGIPNHGR